MSWYHTAKLAEPLDMDMLSNQDKYFMCRDCRKFAVIDENNELKWKFYYEMTPDEQHAIDECKQHGAKRFVDYTICDQCDNEATEQLKARQEDISHEEV